MSERKAKRLRGRQRRLRISAQDDMCVAALGKTRRWLVSAYSCGRLRVSRSLITNDITSQRRYVRGRQRESANTKSVIMKSFVNEWREIRPLLLFQRGGKTQQWQRKAYILMPYESQLNEKNGASGSTSCCRILCNHNAPTPCCIFIKELQRHACRLGWGCWGAVWRNLTKWTMVRPRKKPASQGWNQMRCKPSSCITKLLFKHNMAAAHLLFSLFDLFDLVSLPFVPWFKSEVAWYV